MQTTPGGGPTVLVADEDAPTRAFLADNLQADGFRVLVAGDLVEARARLSLGCDLAVADLNGSTLALVEDLAAAHVPTIVLADHSGGAEWHAIRALERGCDDYVRKPFSYGELLGRVRALLRRRTAPIPPVLSVGGLRIDFPGRTVTVDGRHVHLTPLEFELLCALARRPTSVVTTAHLLRDVWQWGAIGETRAVSTAAHRLRRKLGSGYVESVRGHGLRLLPIDSV
jgi:DNA-binding response OmpR family regulator